MRWMGAAVGTLISLGVLLPATVVGALYLDFSLHQYLRWGPAVILLAAVGAPLALTRAGAVAWVRASPDSFAGALRALQTWADGDETDPVATWQALLLLPQGLARRSVVLLLALELAVTWPLAIWAGDLSVEGAIGLAYAYVFVGAMAGLLVMCAAQVLLREAVEELGDLVPLGVPLPGRGWSLRRRLFAGTVAASLFAGIALPAMVRGTDLTTRDYSVGLAAATTAALYAAFVLDVGIFVPMVSPLRELLEGTRRVARGDLTVAVPVSTIDEIGDLASSFNDMMRGLRERESLHAAFGSYVDPALAERLLTSGSSIFEGEDLVVSVLFADVRDFTSFSERVTPAEAVLVLNRLFDVVVPILHEHGGHANHYLGDGLLAVFGAPQPLLQHADAAVAAAVDIQRQVRESLGKDLRIGIGINTGSVIAGTVGGGGRLEFTVIGDTVNVAARVEALTKETGDLILITEATRRALTTPRPRSAKRGEFEVRGKVNRVSLHAVDPFPITARRSTR